MIGKRKAGIVLGLILLALAAAGVPQAAPEVLLIRIAKMPGAAPPAVLGDGTAAR
jgi:hypothetical protein